MKHGRVISIKNERLIKLRNNLRRVICLRVYDEKDKFRKRSREIRVNRSGPTPKASEWSEIHLLQDKIEKLERCLRNSICLCGLCGNDESDMIYNATWGEWWCLQCFEDEKERTDPKNFFNKGIIVNELATKPCWILDWCPYGPLVEDFMIRTEENDYTCEIFKHDCPVFYVSEEITEKSDSLPQTSEKLSDNLKNCRAFNNKRIKADNLKKPCLYPHLDLCPYGSLGDEFFKRECDYKFGCKIFPHDCPAFYHIERIREPYAF